MSCSGPFPGQGTRAGRRVFLSWTESVLETASIRRTPIVPPPRFLNRAEEGPYPLATRRYRWKKKGIYSNGEPPNGRESTHCSRALPLPNKRALIPSRYRMKRRQGPGPRPGREKGTGQSVPAYWALLKILPMVPSSLISSMAFENLAARDAPSAVFWKAKKTSCSESALSLL